MELFENLWVVLVTFERMGGVSNDILSSGIERASGYMGVLAETEWEARTTLEQELKDINLKLVETDDFCSVNSIGEISELDEHLAYNVERWEDGCDAAWGTIHESYGIAC